MTSYPQPCRQTAQQANNTMAKSSNFETERRKNRDIRRRTRSLAKKIHAQKEDIANPDKDTFKTLLAETTEIAQSVTRVREAGLEGQCLVALATHAAQQAERLNSTTEFDVDAFISRLSRDFTKDDAGEVFDWAKFGDATNVCFQDCCPELDCLWGPLEAPRKEKQVKKRKKAEEEEIEPEAKVQDVGSSQMKDPDRNVQRMKKLKHILQEETEKKPNGVDFFETLLNPNSFTQTVENIFDFAFLLRDGSADLQLDKHGLPVTQMTNPPGPNPPSNKQVVVSFSMKDFEALKASYGIKTTRIPHRSNNQQKASDQNQGKAKAKAKRKSKG